jgi:hypothetical protein
MLIYISVYISIYGYLFIYIDAAVSIYIYTEIRTNENGNFRLFAANGNRKAEDGFPSSTNDKRRSTFAVSANEPIMPEGRIEC